MPSLAESVRPYQGGFGLPARCSCSGALVCCLRGSGAAWPAANLYQGADAPGRQVVMKRAASLPELACPGAEGPTQSLH
jgi:hypothetical protein